MADDIARWSEELAQDPASGVFIPLADALRRRGELDLAMKVATRGLARRPYDGDAHDLLARIWADKGDVERAMDEWSMALQCAPCHAGALKGMGFACHQAGQVADAERYLIQAAAADPDDASIPAALGRVRAQRQAAVGPAAVAQPGDEIAGATTDRTNDRSVDAPSRLLRGALQVETTPPAQSRPPDADQTVESLTHDSHTDAGEPLAIDPRTNSVQDARQDFHQDPPTNLPETGEHQADTSNPAEDARTLFTELLGGGEQAALVLDGHGLVLAGCYVIADGRDVAQDVGAALSGVSDEARRAMRHLDLGAWSSLLFETDAATVAMGPLPSVWDTALAGAGDAPDRVHDGIALVAAGPKVPLGLVRRLLARVLTRAATWLEDPTAGAGS